MKIIKMILGVFDNAKDFDDAYWESKYNEENGVTEAETTVPMTA